MIVLDLETSGLDSEENGIVAVGAVDFLNPKTQFYEECKLDKEDKIFRGNEKLKSAIKVTGFNEREMRNSEKPSQKETLQRFIEWSEKCKVRNLAGENPSFDSPFLERKVKKYGLHFPFPHRSYDLHSMASLKYFQVKGKFLIEKGKSEMSLPNTLKFCGLFYEGMIIKEGKIVKEGKPHNALEDAKLEAECFSRLIYGKSFLEEFKKFSIPEYLKIRQYKKQK